MRRGFRWVMHGVMGAALGLGLVVVVAWCLSYSFRPSVSLVRGKVMADHQISSGTVRVEKWTTLGCDDGFLVYANILESRFSSEDSPPLNPGYTRIVFFEYAQSIRVYLFMLGTSYGTLNTPINWLMQDGKPMVVHASAWGVAAALLIPPLLWFYFAGIAPAFRHRRRLRGGLCLHCGYNLTGVGSDTCPECGAERAHDLAQQETDTDLTARW